MRAAAFRTHCTRLKNQWGVQDRESCSSQVEKSQKHLAKKEMKKTTNVVDSAEVVERGSACASDVGHHGEVRVDDNA